MDDLTDELLDSLDNLRGADGADYGDMRMTVSRFSTLSQEDDDVDIEAYRQTTVIMSVSELADLEPSPVNRRKNAARKAMKGKFIQEEEEHEEEEGLEKGIDMEQRLNAEQWRATSTQSMDLFGTFYNESQLKMSQRSYASDGTDRSPSFASEGTDSSPLQSPQEADFTPSRDEQNRHPGAMYGHRMDMNTSHYAPQKSLRHDRVGRAMDVLGPVTHVRDRARRRPHFSDEDLRFFDPQLGRGVFLDEMAEAFVDNNNNTQAKSLSSYRISSVYRMSKDKTDVIKQGWLFKKSEFMPKWHKRWFTLRRMPQGPMLTYAKDNSENAPSKSIVLSSTSRCIVAPKPAKDHEFRILTSADSSRKEYAAYGMSSFELTEWVRAIQSAINAGNQSAFDGSADFQRIWKETGIQGFILRFGIRKVSGRSRLQTRVLELNFADQTITNSRRGESLSTMQFGDLVRVSPTGICSGEDFGMLLDFNGKHRSWPIFLDTRDARDDCLDILQKIVGNAVTGADLEARCSRLQLKSGVMERRGVGPQATLKGRLRVNLFENCLTFYPDDGDVNSSRPWYVLSLKGAQVSMNEAKCLIAIGRLLLTCGSQDECRNWHGAIMAAVALPNSVIQAEVRERVGIRNSFQRTVLRLRKLLKANVKPEVNGPPKDHKTIELMMRKLWELTFPGEAYTSNADPRWQEIGFQRGGPASDLRSTGLLGLYCLTYFVSHPSGAFNRILTRTRYGVSQGDMKNYPLSIGCINVAALLSETLGFGDAGSHSEKCSHHAMKSFARFVARTVPSTPTPKHAADTRCAEYGNDGGEDEEMGGKPLSSFTQWDDIVKEADNLVFENMFCVLYPVLDMLFVEMGAGYMEFGQVVAAFQRRLTVIFDAQPYTMGQLEVLAAEPCTDTLVAPSIISKSGR